MRIKILHDNLKEQSSWFSYRKSFNGEYSVVDGAPRNPEGRTGIQVYNIVVELLDDSLTLVAWKILNSIDIFLIGWVLDWLFDQLNELLIDWLIDVFISKWLIES